MFTSEANFKGISKKPELNSPFQVGKILQKVVIDVNEEGTEAAAVTRKYKQKFICSKFKFHQLAGSVKNSSVFISHLYLFVTQILFTNIFIDYFPI